MPLSYRFAWIPKRLDKAQELLPGPQDGPWASSKALRLVTS